jgi:hypothetical protein
MKNYFKFLLAAGTAIICGLQVHSQTTAAATPTPTTTATENMVSLGDNVKMKIGGFLKSDIFYDTRKNVEIVDGLFLFYPNAENPDANGKDIDAVSQIRMSAVTSRLNTKFTGPDVLNAKTTALIEFDFSGFNSIGLRLRHAYVKLNWTNDEVLFGRFWHPLFCTDVFPTVLALNTGAPFNVFNRTEQIRFTRFMGSFSAMIATTMQYDYSFPSEFNQKSAVYFSNYYHNSIIPDLSLNLQFKTDMLIIGATANYKVNQPKTYTEGPTTGPVASQKINKYVTDEKVSSIAISGYAQVKAGLLKVKASGMYGENMREFLMIGGYAIKTQDTITGKETYSTMNNLSTWANILYGDALQGGLFVGYTKNLGSSDKTLSSVSGAFSRGSNIDKIIRISPMVSYKTGKLQFQFEIEHTIASYAKATTDIDLTNGGKIKNTTDIANTRVQFSTFFYF